MKYEYTNLRRTIGAFKKRELLVLVLLMPLSLNVASAQTAPSDDSADGATVFEELIVTGSRIRRQELEATSPVTTLEREQIQLDRAITVQDIAEKLPQAAAGSNSTGATVGDSLGSSTLDLRGLGQNRTLVLVNGTRAVPFSFRNAVDVNAIPAGLLKRVDVLTGGAAAVYGADAVAGVVNFVTDDTYQGAEVSAGFELADGGAEQFNVDAILGSEFADGRGHVVGYLGYSERRELLAGERAFAQSTVTSIPSQGGNYTDLASGNFFSIDSNGSLNAEPQAEDVTAGRYLIQPLERLSVGAFFKYELAEDRFEAYGSLNYAETTVTGAGSTGQTPVSVNEVVQITRDNPFLTTDLASQLTFDDNGVANVNVERSLGLGLQETSSDRDTTRLKLGLRGALTTNIEWDLYGQYGKTDEVAYVFNNGIRNDANGNSRFAAVANSRNIFDPNTAFNDLSQTLLHSERERTQTVVAISVFGDSGDFFELPVGPIKFALGYESRDEEGQQDPGPILANRAAYGLGGFTKIDGDFDADEFYGELLVPLVEDAPFIKSLNLEAAYRVSDYSNTEVDDTYKYGLSWAVNDSVRFRATRQTSVRAPNLGEFAAPSAGIPLSLLDPGSDSFIPRLGGRYNGDPCLDGTGDQAQCDRLSAAAQGTPFDSSTASYTFGGNPNILPEQSETTTVGLVLRPASLPGMDLTIDYYDIEISDAVGVIQPAVALQSCYIDNPVAGNPLCGAVLRDPATGLISRALVNDFNLAFIDQRGVDIGFNYQFDAPEGWGQGFKVSYFGNIVTSQSRQNNAAVDEIDCKGTYGNACSSDLASVVQADYKHRVSLDWALNEALNIQLSWRRIGEVANASDRSETISAQNYLDLSMAWNVASRLSLVLGVDNILDNDPPTPASGANFFGTVSDYDLVGTRVGATLRYKY